MPTPKAYTGTDGTTTWRVRFRHPNGASGSKTLATREDAQWFAETIEARGVTFALRCLADLTRDAGHSMAPALDKVFDEFAAWKSGLVRSTRTVADYRRQYRESIAPTLGDVPVDLITAEHVAQWVEDMVTGRIVSARTGKTFAPKTIAGRHALLYAVLEYAASPRRRYVDANPCGSAELPKRLRATPKGLMPAEWQALHAMLTRLNPDAADLAAFMLGSGWRWGEASALTPAGVEDYGSALYVTMNQVRRRDETGAFVVAELEGKAQKSMRRIRLDASTAAILRRRVVGLGVSEPVFTQADGDPWTQRAADYWLRRAAEKAGLQRTPSLHWLRHTHVAWLAMSGAPLPELQARIGHASIQTTIGVYGSLIGDVQDSTLDAFSAMRDAAPVALPGPALTPSGR